MYQAGLVLENGEMRGAYTAGVLDFFLEKGIEFSGIYGVSAGARQMCRYICKRKCEFSEGKEQPFSYDYKAFNRYEGRAYSVATDTETGKPEYMRIRNIRTDLTKLKASSARPLLSGSVKMDGRSYLTGDLSDAIPLKKSIADGNLHNVVILTKEEGFVKRPSSQLGLMKLRYLREPKTYELVSASHLVYNASLKYLAEQQNNGSAFVIRPKKRVAAASAQKERSAQELYLEGYADAEECFEEMINYLESGSIPEETDY